MTPPTTAARLRALIKNDEHLVAHLADQLRGEDGVVDALPTPAAYPRERDALLARLGVRLLSLQERRAQLAALRAQTLYRPSSAAADAHAPSVAQPAASRLNMHPLPQ